MAPALALRGDPDTGGEPDPLPGDGQDPIRAIGERCPSAVRVAAISSSRTPARARVSTRSRISRPIVSLATELTLILTWSSLTAPPRHTILTRAMSRSPRSSTTLSTRQRSSALRRASVGRRIGPDLRQSASEDDDLVAQSLADHSLRERFGLGLSGERLFSLPNLVQRGFQRRSSSPATRRLSGSTRLNCRSASAAAYRLRSSWRSVLERSAVSI